MDYLPVTKRLPPWFRIRLTTNKQSNIVRNVINAKKINTVCRSAACPNQTECWNSGTATFLILGNLCTRNCRFCNVPKGRPEGLDRDEPNRVAEAVSLLKLHYAVITSVTRDDLDDGGAGIFADTIQAIHKTSPDCRIEVLIPDFLGSETSLRKVLEAGPDVLNHNLETVPSLYPQVRPQADYHRSLQVLQRAVSLGFITKTGLMLGLGEGRDEILDVLEDARQAGCSILTLGQYLQPGKERLQVKRYYHPDEFEVLRDQALRLGFRQVVAGPLVRSSYHAEQHLNLK
jgi:lipoic acid synthetase